MEPALHVSDGFALAPREGSFSQENPVMEIARSPEPPPAFMWTGFSRTLSSDSADGCLAMGLIQGIIVVPSQGRPAHVGRGERPSE